MESQSSNERDLRTPIREFIELLEGLLCIKYPLRPPIPTPETRKKPILKEVTKLIIGYHYLTSDRKIALDTTVYRWLELGPEDIPSADVILKGLTQPHIVNALATHGLATYRLPQMLPKEDIPSPIHISLTEPRTRYCLDGYEKQSYMFTASNIVQASIIIKTEANILAGALSYRIDYVIGKEGAPSTLPAASIPFKEPTNLSVLLYNALRPDLYSFRKQIDQLWKTLTQ
ncbi:hypothetical protein COLO4_24727 [Corchorus olitorius]|uniref:Uncharacterized protein n=1 Tax=Corchorus olitorius TaxID=93759 RepID=A0A1R3I7E9_9ROSI|nr:hypothetical protein COLO4_24727 [Corchorus olitorius]